MNGQGMILLLKNEAYDANLNKITASDLDVYVSGEGVDDGNDHL